MITLDILRHVCPLAKTARLQLFIDPLNEAMDTFDINTLARAQMFIAQIAHESGSFHYVEELASGAAYDTGKKAIALGNTPEEDGDGERYKGRGLIQITGRTNYAAVSKALNVDFLADPELLEDPRNAAGSAAWFWQAHHCNEAADAGNFQRVTKIINGGLNGYNDRLQYFDKAKEVIV